MGNCECRNSPSLAGVALAQGGILVVNNPVHVSDWFGSVSSSSDDGWSDPPSVASSPKKIAPSPAGTPVGRGTETSAVMQIKAISSLTATVPEAFEPVERRKPST